MFIILYVNVQNNNQKSKCMRLLTAHRQAMAERDAQAYDMYQLMVQKGAQKIAAMDAVREKFRIYTYNTVYNILRRESQRREKHVTE